jgi:hypothetical protein
MSNNLLRKVRRPLFWGVLALLGLTASAETGSRVSPASVPAPAHGNRYLIIVETSREMQRRLPGVQEVTKALIASGMDNQVRAGDTLGLWTYNADLHFGQFPLQTLTTKNLEQVSAKIEQFLGAQKFEKKPNLEKIMPALDQVVKSSELLTVVLISSGETDLKGTPFDGKINASYETWRKKQQQAHLPFVTVLRGEHRQLSQYSVNPAPWKPELPPVPKELAAPSASKPPASVAPKVAPLIVSGRKPELTQAVPAQANAPRPAPAEPAPLTVRPPTETSTPSIVSAPSPAPAVGQATTTILVQPQASAPTAARVETAASSAAVPVASPPPSVETKPSPSVSPVTVVPAATNSIAKLESKASPVVATPPAAPKAEEPAPAPAASAPIAAPTTSSVAASASEPGFFSNKLVWASGAVLLVSIVGLVFARRNRSRTARPISLITHSLDHQPQQQSAGRL